MDFAPFEARSLKILLVLLEQADRCRLYEAVRVWIEANGQADGKRISPHSEDRIAPLASERFRKALNGGQAPQTFRRFRARPFHRGQRECRGSDPLFARREFGWKDR